MNYKQLVILITVFLCCSNAHPFVPTLAPTKEEVNIDEKLKQLAIEKGIIPKNADHSYLRKEMDEKNTVTMWILMSRENKITMIDGLKKKYKEEGIIINNSTGDYVDSINIVIYDSILSGDIDSEKKKGIGTLFKALAIMNKDYKENKRRD